MMKIIEIGTGYTSIPAKMGAATEIVVEELTRSMIKAGYDIVILDIKDKNRLSTNLPIVEAYMPQFFSSTDVKLGIIHKVKRVLYSISLTLKLRKLLKTTTEPTILHFHNQYNMFFFLKLTPKYLREKVTVIYTNHSYVWQGKWDDIKDVIKKRYFQETFCCRHADKVFVLNSQTKAHLVDRYNVLPSQISLVPNGVNISTYFPLDITLKNKLTQQMGFKDKIVFFQAGSVCSRKNQLTAIKLLEPFLVENKDIVFVYAGGIISHEYKQEIDTYIKDKKIMDQVVYVGELKPGEDLNNYYNIARAFIFPSTSEGFSLVILEAMAAGTPVFVDSNAGLKVPGGEECGCIVYNDSNDFQDKIRSYVLSDDYDSLSIRARKCIEKDFSWDRVADTYIRKIT